MGISFDLHAALGAAVASSFQATAGGPSEGPETLSAPPMRELTRSRGLARTESGPSADRADDERPVLQLNRFQMPLDPSRYANALSNSNPNGDQRSLFAFRQLVDPIPTLSRYYAPQGSTEELYGAIVKGATAEPDASFVQRLLAIANQSFEEKAFPAQDGLTGGWRPCYATPEDWHDRASVDFAPVSIDLSGKSPDFAAFAVAGDDAPDVALAWRLGQDDERPLDDATHLQELRFKGVQVLIHRPWMMPSLFDTTGWYLGQQRRFWVSDGQLTGNRGVLPLLPCSLLVGFDVEISADWSQADARLLDEASSGKPDVAIGQFAISSAADASYQFAPEFSDGTVTSPALQVIGWLSTLVPPSPTRQR